MTKTKGLLLGVLVFTLLPFFAHAQDIAYPSETGFPEISIYPNPIKDVATFEFNQGSDKNWELKRIMIFNLVGEIVYSTQKEQEFECSKNISKPCTLEHKVDFSDQETGAYFVEFQGTNSKTGENLRRTMKIIYNP